MAKISLLKYLEEIEATFDKKERSESDANAFLKLPLNSLECVYIFDFSQNKILLHKGFDHLFGYDSKDFGMDFIFDKYHPEDALLIQTIVKATIKQLMQITVPEYLNVLNMSYRFRKSNGEYANIMSNTIVIKTNDHDQMEQVLIKYTDISFTSESEAVEWMADATYLDEEIIKKEVYGEDKMIFTNRELEVIKHIFDGDSNDEISTKLYISKHTVTTHRKNILLKSGCHDTNQLKDYCLRKGIKY